MNYEKEVFNTKSLFDTAGAAVQDSMDSRAAFSNQVYQTAWSMCAHAYNEDVQAYEKTTTQDESLIVDDSTNTSTYTC